MQAVTRLDQLGREGLQRCSGSLRGVAVAVVGATPGASTQGTANALACHSAGGRANFYWKHLTRISPPTHLIHELFQPGGLMGVGSRCPALDAPCRLEGDPGPGFLSTGLLPRLMPHAAACARRLRARRSCTAHASLDYNPGRVVKRYGTRTWVRSATWYGATDNHSDSPLFLSCLLSRTMRRPRARPARAATCTMTCNDMSCSATRPFR